MLTPMIITVTGYKGGIGKTTTAIHLAAYLQKQAATVLVDGDLNRSATGWARNGHLPFRVADERQAARVGREFEHIVIDTAARPVQEDLQALVTSCDHLIIPTTPDALALDALVQTVHALEDFGATNYRVLLTIVPPAPSRDGAEALASLTAQNVPVFATVIPRLAAFTKAALAGLVVSDVTGDPRAQRAWEAYAHMGKELG
jgi:chromosome partitioning protein